VLVGAILLKPARSQSVPGTLLPQRRPLADFSLSGSDGQPYTKASLAGHWSNLRRLYFCPTSARRPWPS